MKLYLHKGYIYPTADSVIVIQKNEVETILLDQDIEAAQYNWTAVINGHQVPFSNSFVIDNKMMAGGKLDITIKATHKQTGDTLNYKSEPMTITRAFILGSVQENYYPEAVKDILDRVLFLEDKIKAVNDIPELKKDVDLCLNGINEINNKGGIV